MSDPAAPTTPIDVAHIARLARLALTPDEQAHMAVDLEKILGYIDELRAVDVSGVAPMSHPLPFVRAYRADVATPALTQAVAIAGAPAADGEAFIVPKVV